MNTLSSNSCDGRNVFFAPALAQMVIIRRCNLACTYCHEFDHSAEPVGAEAIYERLTRVHALGTKAIELTGGEPLLHPEIVRFVGYAKRAGFARVAVKTNGILITKATVGAFNQSGLDVLQLSVDAMIPNRVTAKAIEPLRSGLALLAEHARFRVIISTVIGSTNPVESIAVIKSIQAMGFVPRVLLRHGKDGQMSLSEVECRAYTRLITLFPNLFNEAGGYRRQLLLGHVMPYQCRAGCKYLYIDEAGIVHWCSQQQHMFGKALAEYAPTDLVTQFQSVKPCSAKCTLGCARAASYEYRDQ
jgi:MoaA/NifB/PqqE/SkfB family radical SAM enzyme